MSNNITSLDSLDFIVDLVDEAQFFKGNMWGASGSGKTHTGSQACIGLHKAFKSKKPIYFFDTEGGSGPVKWLFDMNDVPVKVVKTRAFSDLLDVCRLIEKEKASDIIFADSLTHYWKDLCDSYTAELIEQGVIKPNGKLRFNDYMYIKSEWAKWVEFYNLSPLHIFANGRARDLYDYFQADDGKWEVKKTDTAMSVEKEFSYESILVLEIGHVPNRILSDDPKDAGYTHQLTVKKDRFSELTGDVFNYTPMKRSEFKPGLLPVFNNLQPLIDRINPEGEFKPYDATRNSRGVFPHGASNDGKIRKQRTILLEEIEELIKQQFPGQTKEEKKTKIDLLELAFNTRAWTAVQDMNPAELRYGLRLIVNAINKMKVEAGETEIGMPLVALDPEDNLEETKQEKVA